MRRRSAQPAFFCECAMLPGGPDTPAAGLTLRLPVRVRTLQGRPRTIKAPPCAVDGAWGMFRFDAPGVSLSVRSRTDQDLRSSGERRLASNGRLKASQSPVK